MHVLVSIEFQHGLVFWLDCSSKYLVKQLLKKNKEQQNVLFTRLVFTQSISRNIYKQIFWNRYLGDVFIKPKS